MSLLQIDKSVDTLCALLKSDEGIGSSSDMSVNISLDGSTYGYESDHICMAILAETDDKEKGDNNSTVIAVDTASISNGSIELSASLSDSYIPTDYYEIIVLAFQDSSQDCDKVTVGSSLILFT